MHTAEEPEEEPEEVIILHELSLKTWTKHLGSRDPDIALVDCQQHS